MTDSTRQPANATPPKASAFQPALPRKSIWIWLALGLLLTPAAFLLDRPIEEWVRLGPAYPASTTNLVVSEMARFISDLGEGWVIGVIGLILSTVAFFRRRFDASRLIMAVVLASLLTGLAATICRTLIGRTRPSSQQVQGFYGIRHEGRWILGKAEFSSFPSGHASTCAALAMGVFMAFRRFSAPAILFSLLVSWSRMALNCHHFSDVVAATFFGVFGAYWVMIWINPLLVDGCRTLEKVWFRPETPSNPQG
jgi:membrane-associated phospholipid phosphatase